MLSSQVMLILSTLIVLTISSQLTCTEVGKTRLNLNGDACVASCTGNFADPSGATVGSQCVCAAGMVPKTGNSDCESCQGPTPRINLKGDTCVANCTGNFADPSGATTGSQCVCATGKTANADKTDCTQSTTATTTTSSTLLQCSKIVFIIISLILLI